MKTLITITIATLIGISNISFTSQIPDNIIYKGKEYMLHSNPLESYFKEYPGKRPEGGITSSALWRGYVATFAVKDSLLVLNDIEIEIKGGKGEPDYVWKSVIDRVFPEKETVHINWFTGILVLPYGELKKYVHMGYASTYSNYILLEIEAGVLKDERRLNCKEYEEFRQKQFEAFRKTDKYEELVEELTKDGQSKEYVDSFLKIYVVSYTSKFLD